MLAWQLFRGFRAPQTTHTLLPGTAQERAKSLLAELESDKTESRRKAKGLERCVAYCWWGSITLGALASLGGLLAAVPEIQNHLSIKPWHISVLALCSSGLVVLRRKTSWRKKSDIFYGRERNMDTLIGRVKYRMPIELNLDQIGEVAKDFDEAKEMFGKRMHAVNSLENEHDNGPKPS